MCVFKPLYDYKLALNRNIVRQDKVANLIKHNNFFSFIDNQLTILSITFEVVQYSSLHIIKHR